MAWKPDTPHKAIERDCPKCGAPTVYQPTGLPLVVTADAERLTPDEAARRTGPNRLQWCLRESKWTGIRLTEVLPSTHHTGCQAHVVDHVCAPETHAFGRRPEGAMW